MSREGCYRVMVEGARGRLIWGPIVVASSEGEAKAKVHYLFADSRPIEAHFLHARSSDHSTPVTEAELEAEANRANLSPIDRRDSGQIVALRRTA